MTLSRIASALTLSLAMAATLAAAPQTTTATAKKAPAKTAAKAAPAKAASAKVAAADLPQAVTDAVMKAHPKGAITAAVKVTKGTAVTYRVTVKDGAKRSSMMMNEDGTVVMAKVKASKTKAKAK